MFELSFSAEREGFEPPAPLSAAVFKTAVIDHSTISPDVLRGRLSFQKRCKGTIFYFNLQVFCYFFLYFFNVFCYVLINFEILPS